jgi:E3 ubiquitin-protein ligase BAH
LSELTSDLKFFHLLSEEVTKLGDLNLQEEQKLNFAVLQLSEAIQAVAEPKRNCKNTDLCTWRDVFSLYIESQIFFSTEEHTRRTRSSESAQAQLQQFSMRLVQVSRRFRRHESLRLLERFLSLNHALLRGLKFQELNVMAMTSECF